MTTASAQDVVEMVSMLLEAENVAEMSDEDPTTGNGVYITDASVQTDEPNECCALAVSEMLDRALFVRKTIGPYIKFSFLCNR